MKRSLALSGAVLLVLVLLAGCEHQPQPPQTKGAPNTTRSGAMPPPTQGTDPWAALRQKPLHLPALSPGATCPVALEKQLPNVGLALGDGPLYPVGPWIEGAYSAVGAAVSSDGWSYLKVLWAADPSFQGQALIRGHQLDGANELRFSEGAGSPAEAELHFLADESSGTAGDWNTLASYMRVRTPGCYAYQVDSARLSSVIVFEVTSPGS